MANTDSAKVYIKDPSAKLDYSVDWSDWLEDVGDVIVTSTWELSPGITKFNEENTLYTATVWISGGNTATIYTATNHIVTGAGREDDRTLTIRVQDR